MVRLKFKCTSIQEYDTTYTYNLSPVYSNGPENKQYWEYTPVGNLSVTIMKSKGKLFIVGQEYLIDIAEEVK